MSGRFWQRQSKVAGIAPIFKAADGQSDPPSRGVERSESRDEQKALQSFRERRRASQKELVERYNPSLYKSAAKCRVSVSSRWEPAQL